MDLKNNFMLKAIELSINSVNTAGGPFGCVIVKENKIIAEGSNKVTSSNDPTAHAEVMVMREAAQLKGNYRLGGSIYVTLEPCLMCLGAMIHARVKRLVFGAHDTVAGAAVSV